ncbi:hypothetical protein OIB37_32375 [Streptomyces sp. NBC_00820]|uniref:hypothetical protein n=1 Tax=Streptomyces sp. NBC_00820 TaxID=2975842 RepID=UPI002ECFF284|nr:hypothetical protein OIB37_32375 [Streptomyces sp. NBC_00820]
MCQAIAVRERRLGGALFDRSNRRQIRLTRLGRQPRDDLRPVFEGLRDGLERARPAARGVTTVLRVGMTTGRTGTCRSGRRGGAGSNAAGASPTATT